VQDLSDFMTQAMGVQSVGSSQTDDPNVTVPPGGTIDTDGHIILTGNNGVDNRIQIDLSGMSMTYTDPVSGDSITEQVDMRWTEKQAAVGSGAITDSVVYDSLGTSLPLRLTMVLDQRNGTETTYRWFADSANNSSGTTAKIAVGTGTVTFDTSGNFKKAYEDTVNIYRDGFPTVNPLTFRLDFSRISGLATSADALAVTRQDGSAAGTLNSFIVGENGTITGVFSNGITRTLAQIRLARFANPSGLDQRGQNLYAVGVNSGLAVEGNPGSQGIGSVVAGASELSNTDIGASLIDLILASTMYRGNARVITTVQQMFDELMNLRR
jgi:flagellar hook protein FlgE